MLTIPLRTGRGLNDREHHFKRYTRQRKEQFAVGMFLNRCTRPGTPCTVFLTRIAPSEGLDDDNLVGALKAVRDAVADWIGVDDGKHDVVYRYAQERGPWGIRIEWSEQR